MRIAQSTTRITQTLVTVTNGNLEIITDHLKEFANIVARVLEVRVAIVRHVMQVTAAGGDPSNVLAITPAECRAIANLYDFYKSVIRTADVESYEGVYIGQHHPLAYTVTNLNTGKCAVWAVLLC